MGPQGFSKEIKLKKLPAEIRITKHLSCHLSHCNCYNVPKDLPTPATWPTPSCPLLGKVPGPPITSSPWSTWPTPSCPCWNCMFFAPYSAPIGATYAPNQPASVSNAPFFPNQSAGNICPQPTSKYIQCPILPQPISRSTGIWQYHSLHCFVCGL